MTSSAHAHTHTKQRKSNDKIICIVESFIYIHAWNFTTAIIQWEVNECYYYCRRQTPQTIHLIFECVCLFVHPKVVNQNINGQTRNLYCIYYYLKTPDNTNQPTSQTFIQSVESWVVFLERVVKFMPIFHLASIQFESNEPKMRLKHFGSNCFLNFNFKFNNHLILFVFSFCHQMRFNRVGVYKFYRLGYCFRRHHNHHHHHRLRCSPISVINGSL